MGGGRERERARPPQRGGEQRGREVVVVG